MNHLAMCILQLQSSSLLVSFSCKRNDVESALNGRKISVKTSNQEINSCDGNSMQLVSCHPSQHKYLDSFLKLLYQSQYKLQQMLSRVSEWEQVNCLHIAPRQQRQRQRVQAVDGIRNVIWNMMQCLSGLVRESFVFNLVSWSFSKLPIRKTSIKEWEG